MDKAKSSIKLTGAGSSMNGSVSSMCAPNHNSNYKDKASLVLGHHECQECSELCLVVNDES